MATKRKNHWNKKILRNKSERYYKKTYHYATKKKHQKPKEIINPILSLNIEEIEENY